MKRKNKLMTGKNGMTKIGKTMNSMTIHLTEMNPTVMNTLVLVERSKEGNQTPMIVMASSSAQQCLSSLSSHACSIVYSVSWSLRPSRVKGHGGRLLKTTGK